MRLLRDASLKKDFKSLGTSLAMKFPPFRYLGSHQLNFTRTPSGLFSKLRK